VLDFMPLYVVSEGLGDQIKLVAEGHSGLVERIDRLEKENERQHRETRSHQILK
jgi:sensor histidine kinase YesM